MIYRMQPLVHFCHTIPEKERIHRLTSLSPRERNSEGRADAGHRKPDCLAICHATLWEGIVVPEQPIKGISWSFGPAAQASDPLRDSFQQLERAEALRRQGQLDQARAICEKLVGRHPDYFGALFTLGLICADKQQYPQALGCLVRAAMLNPQSWRALTALSAVYLELGASEMAAHTLEQASLVEPQEPSILLTLGEIYREEQEYELARDAFRKSLELDHGLEAAAIGLGMCCSYLGQHAEAAEIFEGLIKRGMRSHSAFFELINLPPSVVTVDILSELEKLVRDQDEEPAKFENSLAFVRAAVLDRAGRHAEAWEHLVPANRALCLQMQQDAAQLTEIQRANLAQLRDKRIEVSGGGANARTISLFILGPSRSGKSTMEALVAGLGGVKRGYENPGVENAIRRTFQSAGLLTSKLFEVLPPRLDSQCRELYLKELVRRAGSAKVFTNTHPGRIHDVARVAAAFPDVRFIFVKRNLEDNMLRIYMRKYLVANPYAYDLKSIRDQIRWYHEIIDVLAGKLPDIVRVIHYEDMVAHPVSALRVAAELCGLPMPAGPLPDIGDDRDCAAPYRQLMIAELGG
jgi:tetratricopeptide (TPR) repeat protein